jgi:hypothetical protein
MVVIGGEIKLVDYDPEDTVRMGLTALPDAAADAAGGLPISDAGGLDLDAMNVNINEIESDVAAAVIASGTAQSATGTTLVLASATSFADDLVIGATVVITGGSAGVGQSRTIVDWVNTTDTATIDAWTVTPTGTITYTVFATPPASATNVPPVNVTQVSGVAEDLPTATAIAALNNLSTSQVATELATYDGPTNTEMVAAFTEIKGATWAGTDTLEGIFNASGGSTPAAVADAVWDELLSGHVVSGSAGEALSAAGTAGDPWVTALPGSYGAGSAGQIIGDNINATISTRMAEASINTTAGAIDNVTLVATTTTNTDMRGTNSAALASALTTAQNDLDIITGASGVNLLTATQATIDAGATAASIAALNDVAATDIVSAGAITTLSGAVVNVDLVDTTTTNTDMVAEPATLLTTQMAEAYAADGVAPTLAQALFAIQQFLQERSTATTTVTVKRLDGSATAMTFTLDDETTPTSITRTT